MKIINSVFATLLLILCLPINLVSAAQREVSIYNWVDYLPEQVIKDFESKTGIKVNYDVFDSSYTLETKMLTGTSGYDVIFPNSIQVAKFISAQSLTPLDRQALPNASHLAPDIMKNLEHVDPGNRYAVPYLWGTTLIGYNADKVKAALGDNVQLDSWDVLFKEENIAKLQSCGVAVLDAPEEVLPIVMHYLGLDPSSKSKADYEKAEAVLLKIRPYVRYFNSAKLAADLASGDICIAIGWSGAILQAQGLAASYNKGNDIRMLLPKEGTLMWADTMAIPKGARHPEEALAFINYLLDPAVIAQVSNIIGYPNPNKDAESRVNPDLLKNKAMFIPVEQRAHLFSLAPVPVSTERLMTRIWTRIKTGT
ncbi:spermidine/putrescine ABC transporter substrate-binding protein PotF [Pseudomonas fluorescens]|uniref:Spermidine/putrescine ABC transporter substrate-binding protein PotF n=1 Tax=Pseudomonas fluorescens TaxID=294 RepID=A0A1T2YHN8_PSEFL|nr:polyamine ABC transporter substrate-binding protein [Pseudomonas fluorescens]OPA91651.1 spermidine/putrescine ABC transporter substrate-binding protein PotF [Pseudomonas fluorescens]